MKIAVCTNTYRPSINGVVNSIEAFRAGLEASGHDVFICAPAHTDGDYEDDDAAVYRFPAAPSSRAPDYPVPIPASLTARLSLDQFGVDIVHVQHPWLMGSWGRIFARRVGIPVVTTIHTQYEQYAHYASPIPRPVVARALRGAVRRHCRKVDLVITPGKAMRTYLRQMGVKRPIVVVPNATDLDGYDEADGTEVRREHGIEPDEVLFMFVGRAAPEKSLDKVIRAFARIVSDLPRSRLMIVGGGPSLEGLRQMAADQPCASRILVPGPVLYERIREYHAAADIFVTASVTEVQPLSLSEAMAARTPVIGMDAGGINDMIDHGLSGLLVPPGGGLVALAHAMLELGTNGDRRAAMAERAREASRRYAIPSATHRLIDVYKQAIEEHGRHTFGHRYR